MSSAAVPLSAPPSSVEAATLIVSYLEALGVEYVFGVPGGAIEPLYNALAVSMRRGGPRPVLARHEAGAAFMADGYARETGKLGVCCATSGPGATNLLTGVACAFDNSVPLLAITGQPALPLFGRGALQESACTGVNTVGMFRHCTRYNTLVSHVDQLENKLISALMQAMQAPHGPSHLSIPVDILRSRVHPRQSASVLRSLLVKPSLIDEDAVQTLAATVEHSRRMVLIIGAGCGEGIGAVVRFAEQTGSPFVTTPDAKGLINPHHRLYRGVFGFAGHVSAQEALRDNVDLTLAIGTSLGEWTSGAWSDSVLNHRLIHIDENPEHLMRSPMAQQHVRGRILTIFERLLDLMPPQSPPESAPALVLHRDQPRGQGVDITEAAKRDSDATPIKPQRLMHELSRRLPPTTRFVADAGNSTAWAIHHLELRNRRGGLRSVDRLSAPPASRGERRHDHAGWLRVLMDFAPMGWAIGAAVGIARGKPDCPVVCITGDGSYLMNGQEITVAAQEGLTVIFVVLNDAALGMVKHGQRLAGAEQIAFELPRIDYRLMAQAMGVAAHVIESPEDFQTLDMDAILQRGGPTLLDVRIDPEEVPPMSLRMQTLDTHPQ
ncbi:MAG TPA: thiamine pyrophosphate-binding protein [Aquabacterium sp.]|uniref:thiamine pyrophosphate-binding protein n=1 Tax=Aquabacterium sp. TaxID=1872578 RepID=UPI002E31CB1E|nr:thiamine pyrophosphate-binding protein [Aquabacterium sp.]HEX5371230.1 thiamine pyrophosphate-binding protein [Aquabacterium sp.]